MLDVVMVLLGSQWALLGALLVPLAVVAADPALRWSRAIAVTLLAALFAVACADGAGHLLKLLFARPRPCHALGGLRSLVGCGDSFSFPSNHAANGFAVAAVLAHRARPWRWALFALAAAIAYARLHVGAHYPSDVLAGAALGLGIGSAVAMALPRLESRSWRGAPARSSQWRSG